MQDINKKHTLGFFGLLVHISCYFASWYYELGAVLGISLATNLLSNQVATPGQMSNLWWPTVLWLLAFGVLSLFYAQKLREQENIWDPRQSRTMTEHKQFELPSRNNMKFAFVAVLVSLAFSITYLHRMASSAPHLHVLDAGTRDRGNYSPPSLSASSKGTTLPISLSSSSHPKTVHRIDINMQVEGKSKTLQKPK